MAGIQLNIDTADRVDYLKSRVFWGNESPVNLLLVRNFIRGLLAGTFEAGTGNIIITGATATAPVTFTANPANDNTVVVNGVTFTAKSSAPVASNNEFLIGADVTATAANFANIVNTSTSSLIQQTVRATSLAGVVTLTSRIPGVLANTSGGLFTLSRVGANITVGSFTGGTNDTVANFTV